MNDNDKKAEIIDLMKSAKSRKNPAPKGKGIRVRGDSNIVVGRDININKREVTRVDYVPDDRHISVTQAKKIQDKIKDLADMEIKSGTPSQQAYAKWYAILKKRFAVPSYKLIPKHLGEDALDWLMEQKGMLRPKLRRTANQDWRNELYKGIWAKSRSMRMSKADVYYVVHERIGKKVNSLKRLGERDLEKLSNIMTGMYRTFRGK